MRRVFKYQFRVNDTVEIRMPMGARILLVSQQRRDSPADLLTAWALVNDSNEMVTRRLHVRGTGHSCELLSDDSFIETVICAGGDLVWHVFDGGES